MRSPRPISEFVFVRFSNRVFRHVDGKFPVARDSVRCEVSEASVQFPAKRAACRFPRSERRAVSRRAGAIDFPFNVSFRFYWQCTDNVSTSIIIIITQLSQIKLTIYQQSSYFGKRQLCPTQNVKVKTIQFSFLISYQE